MEDLILKKIKPKIEAFPTPFRKLWQVSCEMLVYLEIFTIYVGFFKEQKSCSTYWFCGKTITV